MWARTSAMQSGSGISQPYEKSSFSELSHGAVRSYLPELLALKDNVDDFFFFFQSRFLFMKFAECFELLQ